MTIIERIAAPLEEHLGIKPAVTIAFLTAIILVGVNWIISGDPLDVDALRAAVGAFLIAAAGIVAPPVVGTTTKQLRRQAAIDNPTRALP